MTTMTRAEAICACTNIIDLAECLDETLPAQYSRSVHDKIASMKNFIKDEWRGANITEKMDRAIRNTWDGLRRWDRQGQQNDELFYGLADIDAEPTPVETPTKRDPLEEAKKKGKRGVETGIDLGDLSKEELDKLEEIRQRSLEAAVDQAAVADKTNATRTETPSAKRREKSITAEEVLRQREQTISVVRKQFHEKRIRVIDIDAIKHGDLTAILKKTSSDRTKQLLEAAFCAGKITGAYLLAEELKLRVK